MRLIGPVIATALCALAALLAVYIVLGILYENLAHPLTIISTLPPAGLGALLALAVYVWRSGRPHMAIVGRVPGTGGTSGVDFLLIALFRRAFPALWTTGLGAAAARAGLVAAAG